MVSYRIRNRESANAKFFIHRDIVKPITEWPRTESNDDGIEWHQIAWYTVIDFIPFAHRTCAMYRSANSLDHRDSNQDSVDHKNGVDHKQVDQKYSPQKSGNQRSGNQRRLTFYSFVYRGLSALLTFANGAITARYLPPADRGDYQTMVTYATSGQFFSGGMANYFARAIPRRTNEREQIVQMGNFMMFLLSMAVWLAAAAVSVFGHPSQVVLFALVGAPLTFLFGYSSRLLNAIGEISWLNRANVTQAVIFLLVYLAYIQFNHSITAQVRLQWTMRIWLLTWAVTIIITLFVAYRKLNFQGVWKWVWSASDWRELRGFGFWSSMALFSGYINYRIDFWMVRWVTHDKDLVSVYGIAVVAAEILNTLTQSIAAVVFHRVAAASSDDAGSITEIACKQTLITSTMLACVLAALMPILVDVYGRVNYAAAIGPFYIILPGLILKSAANVIGQYFTNSQGTPRTLLIVNIVVIAFNALICLFLIPKVGMYGAAISSTASYLLELCFYIVWYHRASGRKGSKLWKLSKPDFQPYVDVALWAKNKLQGSR